MDQRRCTEITRQRWSYLPRAACRSLWATALVPTCGRSAHWAQVPGLDGWTSEYHLGCLRPHSSPFHGPLKVSERPHSGSCS